MTKYEKVNKYTIRVIKEQGVDVTLSQLLENKAGLLKQKAQIEGALIKVEKILKEAKRLKITLLRPVPSKGKTTI